MSKYKNNVKNFLNVAYKRHQCSNWSHASLHCLTSLAKRVIIFFMKLFQTNSIEIVRACQESFGFEVPSVLLKKKNGKTRDVFSCVKFMFITLL